MSRSNSIQKSNSNKRANNVNVIQLGKIGDMQYIEIFDNTTERIEMLLRYLLSYPLMVYKFEYQSGSVTINAWKTNYLGNGVWNTVDINMWLRDILSDSETKFEITIDIKQTRLVGARFVDTRLAISKIKGVFNNSGVKYKRVMKLIKQIANALFE